MEIALFQRKPKKSNPLSAKALKNVTRTVSAQQFLSEHKRPELIQSMRRYSGLIESRYEDLCAKLIENLVHYCQKLPETTNTYYSQPGGFVDHALNRTEAALGLFQDFLTEDTQGLSETQQLWQYALYSAAILQNIGSLFIDYKINLFDTREQLLKQWNPLEGNLFQTCYQYDYELQAEGEQSFHHRLNLLLAKTLMPKNGFSWIASNSEVLMVWLALLNEDYQGAGTLGALLIRADAIALQRYFSEFISKVSARRGRFGVAPFADVPESILEKEQVIGIEFIEWLNKSLEEGKLLLNKGPLIMVPGGVLMTQELFQMFQEYSKYASWQVVQKGFLALGLYVLDTAGRAILRFEHADTKEMVSGFVLSKIGVILPNSIKTAEGDSMSALGLINKILQTRGPLTQKVMSKIEPLQTLNREGWETNKESPSSHPGAGHGV